MKLYVVLLCLLMKKKKSIKKTRFNNCFNVQVITVLAINLFQLLTLQQRIKGFSQVFKMLLLYCNIKELL